MNDLAKFHVKLFGDAPLHERCLALYNAFAEDGTRCIATPDYHLADLQAALVIAFYQARSSFDDEGHIIENPTPIMFLVPKAFQEVVTYQLRELAKELFRVRAGHRDGVKAVRDAFHLLRVGSNANQVPANAQWVALQYTKDSPAPPWVLSAIR